jgi:hypothetical protein
MMPDSGGTRRIQTRIDRGCLLVHLKLTNCQWQWSPRSCLLIDVCRWQSTRSNSLAENFLLHRKLIWSKNVSFQPKG